MLIGVSGVGPKAALSILSAATPRPIWPCPSSPGTRRPSPPPRASGKRSPSACILELKDKLAKDAEQLLRPGRRERYRVSLPGDKGSEAAAALAVLGYGSQEIGLALKGVDMDALPLEEIIRQALKKMVR